MIRPTTLPLAALLVTTAAAPAARAAEGPTAPPAPTAPSGGSGKTVETVETVVHEHDDDDADDRDHHGHHHGGGTTWFGLAFGAVATPLGPGGHVEQNRRVTSNPFRACLDPGGEKHCSAVRGFDVRLQMYRTRGAWEYPRVVGYFRTGYQAGFAAFDPEERPGSRGGYARGEARSLSYQAVPLFFGGSIYAFKKFPVRPYAGMGAGFDILRLRYTRHEDRALLDASARIGFELHAGIEARISNVVALSAEVTQLWSARRKLAGVPDFSNEGLTVMAGVAISIPTKQDLRRRHHHVHRRTTVRTETAPAPAPAPAPILVVPTPAPAPVVVAPAPAPVVVAPAPAPVVVAPAPAPVVVAPAPVVVAPAPVVVAPAPAPVVTPAPAPGPSAVAPG
jgi:hypothetical protein